MDMHNPRRRREQMSLNDPLETLGYYVARIESLQREVDKHSELLKVAACPEGCINGAIPVDDGYGGCEARQCRFCYERNLLTPPEGEG